MSPQGGTPAPGRTFRKYACIIGSRSADRRGVGLARTRHDGVRIETLEPARVACYRAIGKEPEHLSLGYLKRWLMDRRVRNPRSVRIFGFDVEVSPEERKRGLRGYEVWATVPVGVRPSAGVRIRTAPGGLYAVLRVRDALVDPYARIPAGWKRLGEWTRRNREYRLTEGLCLEEHIQEGGSMHLDLFVPVAPAPRPHPARPQPRRVPR